jgi:hypothetical protein
MSKEPAVVETSPSRSLSSFSEVETLLSVMADNKLVVSFSLLTDLIHLSGHVIVLLGWMQCAKSDKVTGIERSK